MGPGGARSCPYAKSNSNRWNSSPASPVGLLPLAEEKQGLCLSSSFSFLLVAEHALVFTSSSFFLWTCSVLFLRGRKTKECLVGMREPRHHQPAADTQEWEQSCACWAALRFHFTVANSRPSLLRTCDVLVWIFFGMCTWKLTIFKNLFSTELKQHIYYLMFSRGLNQHYLVFSLGQECRSGLTGCLLPWLSQGHRHV